MSIAACQRRARRQEPHLAPAFAVARSLILVMLNGDHNHESSFEDSRTCIWHVDPGDRDAPHMPNRAILQKLRLRRRRTKRPRPRRP
jgi:hypothetical protein